MKAAPTVEEYDRPLHALNERYGEGFIAGLFPNRPPQPCAYQPRGRAAMYASIDQFRRGREDAKRVAP